LIEAAPHHILSLGGAQAHGGHRRVGGKATGDQLAGTRVESPAVIVIGTVAALDLATWSPTVALVAADGSMTS